MECNILNKCRTCLSENEVMFGLFENYENDISLADIIKCFLNIQFNLCDNLPKQICQECATLLIKFYNFSIIFEESNRKLNTIDGNINKYLKENDFENTDSDKPDLNELNIETIKEEEYQSNVDEDKNIQNNVYKNIEVKAENYENCEEIVICMTNEAGYVIDDDLHKCSICNKKFRNLLLLKRHIQLHTSNKKFICEICGYVSLKKSYLADHMEAHAVDKPHTCNFCGKSFRRRSTFSRHKKIHTNPMEIICEMCGKKFTDRGTLKTHILLLHIKTRNFKCIICQQTFPLKATLEKHLRRHQQKEDATKKFTCTECNMQYFDKSSLKRHYVNKHSGEHVKHKCQYCYKEYTTKTNLHKHIINVKLRLNTQKKNLQFISSD